MAAKIRVGNIGTVFLATVRDQDDVPVALDGADRLEILFRKPSGDVVTQTATVVDASAGTMRYVVIAGDLDEAGMWRTQGFVKIGDGEWYGDVQQFRVYSNLR